MHPAHANTAILTIPLSDTRTHTANMPPPTTPAPAAAKASVDNRAAQLNPERGAFHQARGATPAAAAAAAAAQAKSNHEKK